MQRKSQSHSLTPGSMQADPSNAREGRITLLEEQVAVSSGSTGLRTWTASLHLGHHLLRGAVRLSPRVIELGAGTGFLGTLLTQLGHDVLATDLGDCDGAECPCDEPGARQTPLTRLRRNFEISELRHNWRKADSQTGSRRTRRKPSTGPMRGPSPVHRCGRKRRAAISSPLMW